MSDGDEAGKEKRRAGDYLPSAFVLCELKFHKPKHGVEAKLDQSKVPAKRLESIHRKYQLLVRGANEESENRQRSEILLGKYKLLNAIWVVLYVICATINQRHTHELSYI